MIARRLSSFTAYHAGNAGYFPMATEDYTFKMCYNLGDVEKENEKKGPNPAQI